MIYSAPSENLTLPLGQTTPAMFRCHAQGSFVLWKINGTLIPHESEHLYEARGFTFFQDHTVDQGVAISVSISITTARNNNTRLNCHATGQPAPVTSETVTLTIAG